MTFDYWTQPYPKSIDDARMIRELLRGEHHSGTFANEPQLKPGLSLDEIKKAAHEIRKVNVPPFGPMPYADIDALGLTPWAVAP